MSSTSCDYSRFAERLEECLSALGQLLERPGFGAGPATVGAELELFLVDGAARPLPLNQAIRAAVADPRVTDGAGPLQPGTQRLAGPAGGRPFAALGGELNCCLIGWPTPPETTQAGWRSSASCPPCGWPTSVLA